MNSLPIKLPEKANKKFLTLFTLKQKLPDTHTFGDDVVTGASKTLGSTVMLAIQELFEAHLTVGNLDRAMKFYGGVLGLELASTFPERRVALYWLGGRGKSMLGVWEVGSAPQQMQLHVAFTMKLPDLLRAAEALKAADVTPRDFWRRPTSEPDVLAWMPAASLYFEDPDGNMLEFLAMLPGEPRPELGVIRWSEWKTR